MALTYSSLHVHLKKPALFFFGAEGLSATGACFSTYPSAYPLLKLWVGIRDDILCAGVVRLCVWIADAKLLLTTFPMLTAANGRMASGRIITPAMPSIKRREADVQ